MINLKTASFRRRSSMMRNKLLLKNSREYIRSNIHKCPVNTLLTTIFSEIAWNG